MHMLCNCAIFRAMHWNSLCSLHIKHRWQKCSELNTKHRNGFGEVQLGHCAVLWWIGHFDDLYVCAIFRPKRALVLIFALLQLWNQIYLTPVETWEFPWPCGSLSCSSPPCFSSTLQPAVAALECFVDAIFLAATVILPTDGAWSFLGKCGMVHGVLGFFYNR